MIEYRTIVADPPWKVSAGREIGNYVRAADGSQPFGIRNNAARKLAYPSGFSNVTQESCAALAASICAEFGISPPSEGPKHGD